MNKAHIIIFAFCLQSLTMLAQADIQFGTLTPLEQDFQVYEKDTTASAIYLYEYGDNYFEVRGNYIWLITRYHAKIKILDDKGFDHANIQIPYYHSDKRTEKINKIRAITHNGLVARSIGNEEIYDVSTSERWSEKRFTFPNVKEGSVLEYTYEVQSPFHFNLTGWKFQSDIPKLYSEYNAKIPGNWLYNRALIGEIKLDVNEATIQKQCFSVPGIAKEADCEVLKYAMNHVPAFEDSEEFMLSGSNYRSRLEFELSEYNSFYGQRERFTKSWKDVDSEFRSDKDIGRQLKMKGYFEKNVASDLLTQGEPLERAKNVFDFVKNHFTWNEQYGLWNENRVKTAFDEKIGNAAEINISLINLLNSAGIHADMVLLATRDRGLPKGSHPVMSDFNYVVAKVDLAGRSYLLDATNKDMPFGMLPFRCLNYFGRVMDFEKDSYWYDIKPEETNKKTLRAQVELDAESGKLKGLFYHLNSGYFSVTQKNVLSSFTEKEYLENLEQEIIGDFSIKSYEVSFENYDEKQLSERFEFEIDRSVDNGNVYLNPFFITFFDKNPFISEHRNYPIDFGYTRNYTFSLNLNLPNGYRLKSIPESVNYVLPDNGGFLKLIVQENTDGVIALFFDFKLNHTQYESSSYSAIKDFFSKVVQLQTQSLIVLEKI